MPLNTNEIREFLCVLGFNVEITPDRDIVKYIHYEKNIRFFLDLKTPIPSSNFIGNIIDVLIRNGWSYNELVKAAKSCGINLN
jgi:hypothetical protein